MNHVTDRQPDPTAIIVFGGTGDLAQRKLIPSLFRLYRDGFLPDEFIIVGSARTEYSDAEYAEFVDGIIDERVSDVDESQKRVFCEDVSYVAGSVEEVDTYNAIESRVVTEEEKRGSSMNRMVYLAVPPRLYAPVFDNLAASDIPQQKDNRWMRLLVEKPFGRDLETAQGLEKQLHSLYEEQQIFRIDHYLAKTAVQNLISFRFSNFLFEGSWDKNHITKVHIRMREDFGVEDRGAFYDSVGALRDVGQNHILQMLAMSTMENPQEFSPSAIRSSRAEALKNLTHAEPVSDTAKRSQHLIRGQYGGYTEIEGVDSDSETETYFKIKAELDSPRWEGVSFILESGKALNETCTEIVVFFDQILPCVCGKEGSHGHENVLTIQLKPDQSIDIKFWVRKPGMAYELEEQHLDFSYSDREDPELPEAYEKILFDCLRGDQTLFARSDEVLASWAFITPIIENWDTVSLERYEPGTTPDVSFEGEE